MSQQVVEEVQNYFPDKVFRAIIPRNVRLSEAPSYGQLLSEYDPQSRAAQAYTLLADEVVRRLAHECWLGGFAHARDNPPEAAE